MNQFFIYSILIFLGFVGGLLVFLLLKKRETLEFLYAMKFSLFSITVPIEKEKPAPLQEILKNAEQFFTSLSGIKSKGFSFSQISPYFVFEIAVPRIGEEIHFYAACPKNLKETFQKIILGFWPRSEIKEIKDYNPFNPEGFSFGTFALLKNSSVFPIKTYDHLATEPLSAITSVLAKLEKEGEGAAIQLIVKPTKISLLKKAEEIIKNIEKKTKVKKENFQGLAQLSPLEQEKISAISKKVSLPVFEVNLRIISSAKTEQRALEILNQLKNSFSQFNNPLLNELKFQKLSTKRMQKLFFHFSFRIFRKNENIILNCAELATIFHFPTPYLMTPKVKWLKAKTAPAPPNLPEEGLLLGKNIFRNEERDVYILEDDRRKHFYIIGQTGTGKSTLLYEMVKQDIEKGKGVGLLDPHGDLAEKVLEIVPKERIEDVIYFDPADPEKAIGLNMLEFDSKYPESKTFVVNEILEILEKLYDLKAHGFGGPMFEQYMRNALLLLMEDPESGNTLVEVPRILADEHFRAYKLSKCKNIIVKNFWEKEAEKAGGEAALANIVPYITSKLNAFIANDLVRPIIAQQKSTLNFREIMDEGKILICNLSKGKLGEINSYLLGMIITGKILLAAFSRIEVPEEKRRDFYLYIDEFQNFTTKSIISALAEARKYRLILILAHQFIGQLEEETRKAIFGNVGSIMAFRVGPEDAKFLVDIFAPAFDENDLTNFDNFNAAIKLLIKGQTSNPFNIVTFPPQKGNQEIAAIVKEWSRKKWTKDKEEIEKEVYERLSKIY
jgi:GTPase SAR1 family protein